MNDTERNAAENGRVAARAAQMAGLRARMQAFVTEHERSADLERLRSRVSGGSTAELVIEDRDDQVR